MLQGELMCEIGLLRDVNQDRAALFIDSETALGFVADGIGGHYSGEKASTSIKDALTLWWHRCHAAAAEWSPQELSEHFKAILNECAKDLQKSTPYGNYCGSTIVLLWASGEHYLLLTAGDSRCYRVKSKRIGYEFRQISTDDVYRAKGVADVKMNGKLTNAIGSDMSAFYSIQTGRIEKNTLFALCSDGVYRYCELALLEQELSSAAKHGTLKQTLGNINAAVHAHGAPDNYSMVLLRYK